MEEFSIGFRNAESFSGPLPLVVLERFLHTGIVPNRRTFILFASLFGSRGDRVGLLWLLDTVSPRFSPVSFLGIVNGFLCAFFERALLRSPFLASVFPASL